MSPPSYLAFDLGASSSRAVLGTLDGDVMRLDEVHRFPTPIIETGDHLFWDLESIWDELQTGLRKARQEDASPRALSVDSWGVDYVPLDADGTPLRLPHCYRDPRTSGLMEKANAVLSAEKIYSYTGIQSLSFNTLYQLLADQRRDAGALAQVHQHLTIADYFNYRSCGRAVVEMSLASTTQLMDVHTRTWSDALMKAFGLDPAQWPQIVPSGTRLGPTLDAPEVEVIATCSHDTGSAVAATPAPHGHDDWAYISCGTWSLLGVELAEPLLTAAARQAGFTNEAGLDGTIRFLKNLTGLWPLQECTRAWKETGPIRWEELVAEARAACSRAAPIDLEDPRFLARGDMEQRLMETCREHGQPVPETRGELVRLILESITESYRRTLLDLERLTGRTPCVIHLFGGGAQNTLLCELTADACAKTVVAGPVEATALGNLLIQARTMGDLPERVTIRDVAARSSDLQTFVPKLESRDAPA